MAQKPHPAQSKLGSKCHAVDLHWGAHRGLSETVPGTPFKATPSGRSMSHNRIIIMASTNDFSLRLPFCSSSSSSSSNPVTQLSSFPAIRLSVFPSVRFSVCPVAPGAVTALAVPRRCHFSLHFIEALPSTTLGTENWELGTGHWDHIRRRTLRRNAILLVFLTLPPLAPVCQRHCRWSFSLLTSSIHSESDRLVGSISFRIIRLAPFSSFVPSVVSFVSGYVGCQFVILVQILLYK